MFILLTIFSILYIAEVLLLLKGLCSLPQSGASSGSRFSVIIAARNEEKNLPFCLDCVFKQSIDSERYEVIVVNDRSCDRTAEIVSDYSFRFSNLTLINIKETPAGISSKKHAVYPYSNRSSG
ncbi:MAG: glycosyltransferase [Fibrobacter sp.]|nr:glycosyltransferase [Fibrobacter sp.]